MPLYVKVKVRPWPTRVRNSYRHYRRLGLSVEDSIIGAFMVSYPGSWLDIGSWKIWQR